MQVKIKKTLILASTSPIRKALLARYQLPFKIIAPKVDETPAAEEHPKTLVKRLAIEKARSGELPSKEALIIGCDQVAALLDSSSPLIFGKPGNFQRARQYLLRMSGKKVTFFTGLCVYNSLSGRIRACVETHHVWFRVLSDRMVCEYLKKEHPYSIAGGFKSEGLGIALVKKFSGNDPSSLLGLPLIRLCRFLEQEGMDPLSL
ncbi:MAG: septum formation protein Maf [Gammaproteobacteria bacterium]|nr:septum formation protein Maf [Gammaproteobacteria bacterium]